MSAPLKPWERSGVNQRNDVTSVPQNHSRPSSSVLPVNDAGGGLPMATPSAPPPLPPRPSQQSPYSSYGSSGYSSYGGYGSYGSYGGLGGYSGLGSYSPMYGGYGGYGLNSYSRFGQPSYGGSGFVRVAEDSSRQAFQSIESIVQAFGSVAMMLESTYSAVFNSFRAVLGVADHFSRMRTHFAQIFSALAIIKTLKWLYRRLLVLLRLREAGLEEDVWAAATAQTAEALMGGSGPGGKPKSSWPIMLFFAVIIGGPWLIWKFLSSLSSNQDNGWVNGDDDHFVAVAQFDFQGDSEEELPFRRGQRINIAPKEQQPRLRGWLLGSVDGQKTGVIPANYVKILGKRRGRKQAVAIPTTNPPAATVQRQTTMASLDEINTDFTQSSSSPEFNPPAVQEFENSFPSVNLQTDTFENALPHSSATLQSASIANKDASDILEESSNQTTD